MLGLPANNEEVSVDNNTQSFRTSPLLPMFELGDDRALYFPPGVPIRYGRNVDNNLLEMTVQELTPPQGHLVGFRIDVGEIPPAEHRAFRPQGKNVEHVFIIHVRPVLRRYKPFELRLPDHQLEALKNNVFVALGEEDWQYGDVVRPRSSVYNVSAHGEDLAATNSGWGPRNCFTIPDMRPAILRAVGFSPPIVNFVQKRLHSVAQMPARQPPIALAIDATSHLQGIRALFGDFQAETLCTDLPCLRTLPASGLYAISAIPQQIQEVDCWCALSRQNDSSPEVFVEADSRAGAGGGDLDQVASDAALFQHEKQCSLNAVTDHVLPSSMLWSDTHLETEWERFPPTLRPIFTHGMLSALPQLLVDSLNHHRHHSNFSSVPPFEPQFEVIPCSVQDEQYGRSAEDAGIRCRFYPASSLARTTSLFSRNLLAADSNAHSIIQHNEPTNLRTNDKFRAMNSKKRDREKSSFSTNNTKA